MSARGFSVTPALALVAALVLAGCNNGKEPTYQGWVEAELIFVGPDETGRIETLAVREGDHVEKGALLFALDADLQLADVAMQEAAVKNAQIAYDRALALVKTSSGTQKNLDDAEAALRTFGEGHAVFYGIMGFLAVLLVGFVYTWRKGVFKWN